MWKRTSLHLRGRSNVEAWMGNPCDNLNIKLVGGAAAYRTGYDHFMNQSPQAPPRAVGLDKPLPPVLFNRMDQIVLIENALALQRTENQISVTLSQLSMGIRNAENFLEKHLLHKEVRPSLFQLWFHDGGLREHQHILSALGAHHVVPLFSLIGYDVERGKMTLHEAEELYEELVDCSVAHPKVAQRELADQMIRVYCLHDDYEKAIEVVDEMKSKHIRRSFVTYAPLFRMIRQRGDAEMQMKLLQHMYEVEGGRFMKFVYIDVPRLFYMWGVFIRYNWIPINAFFSILITSVVLHWINFAAF